jgi:hypothetical protein
VGRKVTKVVLLTFTTSSTKLAFNFKSSFVRQSHLRRRSHRQPWRSTPLKIRKF